MPSIKFLPRILIATLALGLLAGCDELDDHPHRYHRHDADGAYARLPPPPPPPPGYREDEDEDDRPPRRRARDNDFDGDANTYERRPPRIYRDDDGGY